MSRPRHPNKHIDQVVELAIGRDWKLRKCTGHAWGRLLCPAASRSGCQVGINSTPKSPEAHARQIRRAIENCSHGGGLTNGGSDD